MALTRRRVLALIGGGTVVAAGAGTGAVMIGSGTPAKALAPWDLAGTYDDPRLRALSYALLAPNPHNRQPWQAELVEEDTVLLYRDPTLNLPETDPYDRQLTIGMGCFLELMVLAAGSEGLAVDVTLFPDGEHPDNPVAAAVFRPGGAADPLFAHAMARRSCKEPFDMTRPVTDAQIAALDAPDEAIRVTATNATDRVEALKDLIWRAWMVEAETPHTWNESIDLIRVGKAEINRLPDGIDVNDPMLFALNRLGLMSLESLKDPNSQGFKGTVEAYRETFSNTPAIVWLTSPGNTRADQIAAGRAWLRLNLQTTGMGLSLHPVSQVLQEYPEMQALYTEAHETLAAPGETVQMLGRVGYGPEIARTPRWPLEEKLRNA